MTWTPADGPSRDEVIDWIDCDGPRLRYGKLASAALAAHDLFEENQRFKAEFADLQQSGYGGHECLDGKEQPNATMASDLLVTLHMNWLGWEL